MCKNNHPLIPCNCDNLDRKTDASDFGRIINKNKLPIKDLTVEDNGRYHLTIGDLRCTKRSVVGQAKKCNSTGIFDPIENRCICKPGYGGPFCTRNYYLTLFLLLILQRFNFNL